jgi:hypothetical protein
LTGATGPQGPIGPQGPTGPAGTTDWNGLTNVPAGFSDNVDNDTLYSAGAGLNLSGTIFSIPSNAITTAMIGDSQVTAAKIANRVRTMTITGSQFIGLTSTSAFNWSGGNRGIAPRSFGSANSNGQMYVAFQVPADYVGPSAADLSANPGIVAPRLRIKWVTDSTASDRRINMDIAWAQETDLNGGNTTRFRYNIRAGGTGTDAADSANPTNVQVATQIVPEPGDVWSSGEGAPVAWAAGQTIFLTFARNATAGDDPNADRVCIISVSFEYESDQ